MATRVFQSFHQSILPEQSIECKCGDGFFFFLLIWRRVFLCRQRTRARWKQSKEKMPCLNISTNVNLDGVDTSAILSEASSQVAKIIKKPESYVMIVLKGSVPISFGGTEQPAAYGELVSIGGLSGDVNKKLSSAIATILKSKLSVPKSRPIKAKNMHSVCMLYTRKRTRAWCKQSTQKMPCLNISTNVNLDGVNTSSILSEASSQVAKILKKPESYVMIVLKGSVPISFGGTEEPAAYGELVSIGGLSNDVNKKLSSAISTILLSKLSVLKSRQAISTSNCQKMIIFICIFAINAFFLCFRPIKAKNMHSDVMIVLRVSVSISLGGSQEPAAFGEHEPQCCNCRNSGDEVVHPQGIRDSGYIVWQYKDQTILGWIISSLSPAVVSTIYGLETSRLAWQALGARFAAPSTSRISLIKRKLQSLQQGSMQCQQFLDAVKSLADELSAVGKPIEDSDLILSVLNGFNSSFHSFVTTAENQAQGIRDSGYIVWQYKDQTILGWIISSLSPAVVSTIYGLETSRLAWQALGARFAAPSTSRISLIKRKLQSLQQGSMQCQQFLDAVKSLADELSAVGKPIEDSDLILSVLNGLNSSFHSFVTTMVSIGGLSPEVNKNLSAATTWILVMHIISLSRPKGTHFGWNGSTF
uniref:Uncharacterized protein n=1 Tax=Salix viminalis TaxID=40686 RepID=A0A6N2MKS3_SALVM